jgi:twitching motility two-component system response regulator PilH
MERNHSLASGRTILIVDDEPLMRDVLKRMLLKQDHLVLTADGGEEAVSLCLEHRPDLILMDILMPDMDGYEATARIKRLAGMADVPVIFLSGKDQTADGGRSSAVGGSVYLCKPFKENQIRDVVNLVLASASKTT